jgi:hypothetical protein
VGIHSTLIDKGLPMNKQEQQRLLNEMLNLC